MSLEDRHREDARVFGWARVTDQQSAEVEALVATVRDGITGDEDDPTMYVQDAYRALDTLAQQIEELKAEVVFANESFVTEHAYAVGNLGVQLGRAEAQRDKAVEALRESDAIVRLLRPDLTHTRPRADTSIAQVRRVLAEIEGGRDGA